MDRHPLATLIIVIAVTLLAPLGSLSSAGAALPAYAQAETPDPLFASAPPPPNFFPPDGETIIRSSFVTLGGGQLTAQTAQVTLNLFTDAVYPTTLVGSTVPDPEQPGRFVWRGALDTVAGGRATLSVNGGSLHATVFLPAIPAPVGDPNGTMTPGRLYHVIDTGQGVHFVKETLLNDPMPEEPPVVVPPEAEAVGDTTGAMEAVGPQDDGSVLDVLVVYTPAVRNRYGESGALALIDLAVAEANQAFANSEIPLELKLVYRGEVSYTEASSTATDLGRLKGKTDGYMDQVHALRNQYQADLVSMIVENPNTCGVANVMSNLSPYFESSAFSVVVSHCATGFYSFVHELMHNLGAQHDHNNASSAIYPYAYGYWAPDYSFRTVMAYDCFPVGCLRVPYFSNPNVIYNGSATGIGHDGANGAIAADNGRAINENRVVASNWRNSSAQLAPTPTHSPTPAPTDSDPTTATPSHSPTPEPTLQVINPTFTPTWTPTNTHTPTHTPTFTPTHTPTATPTWTPPPPYAQRVHVGSTAAFTDTTGKVWGADRSFGTAGPWGYTTGSAVASSSAVANTVDDPLYQKYRELAGEYRFNVPNGTYEVTLMFTEFAVTNGTDRRMNITMEGVARETNFSVWAVVGKAGALDKTYTVTVSDGVLNIAFAKGTSARKSPAINAIEVKTAIPPTPTPTPTPTWTPGGPTATPTNTPTFTPTPTPYAQRVHSGSTAAFTDTTGKVWDADRAFGTAGPWGYTTGSAVASSSAVGSTVDDPLYQKYRELVGEYRFNVPNGTYLVTLKFAEFAVTAATRPMNIKLEGVARETNFSVWAVVGKAVALDKTYTVTVNDGVLNIAFAKGTSAKKSPAINAIEVKTP